MKIDSNQRDFYAPARLATHRRVEKPNALSNLREDGRRESPRAMRNSERRANGRASHLETRLSADREPTGIQAGFVAQVLGQILGTAQDGMSAARAYARSPRARTEPRLIEVL